MSCHQSGSSACANAPCHLCQLTKGNPVGFTCSCPNSKVLLLDGTCECRFTITLICLCYKCLLPIFGRWIDTHFHWLFYFSVNVINESFFCPADPRFIYATMTNINMLEFRDRESTNTQLFATDDGILSFDLDWDRDWLYWANQTGHIQRTSLTQVKTEVVPTPVAG